MYDESEFDNEIKLIHIEDLWLIELEKINKIIDDET